MNPDGIFLPLDMLSPCTSVLTMQHMGKKMIPNGRSTTSLGTEPVAIRGICCLGMYSRTHTSS